MAEQDPDYRIGEKGVNLVASPLHTPEGGLLSAQNVEFIRDAGIGGLGSRAGLAALNAVAGAGAIIALIQAPFPAPPTLGLMVSLNTGETPTWKTSTDGTTYTNLTSAQLQRVAGIDKSPSGLGAGAISSGQRVASFKSTLYYPGDSYTLTVTAPPFVLWGGAGSAVIFVIPTNPTSAGAVPLWIADTWIFNGVIYLAIYDPGGAAPDVKGRVLAFDPTNGTLADVGNRFGNGSGENSAGFPFCLTSYFGYLWAGTYGISGNNQGKVYRIRPGVDTTWTLDLTATLHNGYFMSLCGYRGVLYAATDADATGTAIVQARSSTGTWTTSLTAPAANANYFAGLTVFNDLLFCCYYKGATGVVLIKKFDGTSWTTDLDVAGTYAAKPPGLPYVYNGNLYWPFLGGETSPASTAGFLLKRTTGAVWSRVLNNVGIRGGVGQYTP